MEMGSDGGRGGRGRVLKHRALHSTTLLAGRSNRDSGIVAARITLAGVTRRSRKQ